MTATGAKRDFIITADMVQRALYIARVSSALILAFGLILFVSSLGLSSKKTRISTIEASAPISASKIPLSEINIANSGAVFARGAKVTSISNNQIQVSIGWNESNLLWNIKTDSATKFLDAKGVKNSFDNIQVGSILMITGNLISGGAEPSVDAQFVRIVQ